MGSYLKDPAEIYARSFAIVRETADLSAFDGPLGDVAVRLIHACGMPDIVDDMAASDDFVASAGQAIAGGRRCSATAKWWQAASHAGF